MPVDGLAEYEVADRLWKARGNIILIPQPAGDFLTSLADVLDERRSERSIDEIVRITGENPDDLRARLREHEHTLKHVTPGELLEAIEQIAKIRSI
jgi:hypothetical protein